MNYILGFTSIFVTAFEERSRISAARKGDVTCNTRSFFEKTEQFKTN